MNETIYRFEKDGNFKEALIQIEQELSRLREEYNNSPSEELNKKIKSTDINRIACKLKLEEDKNNQLFLRGRLINKLQDYLKLTEKEEKNYIKYLIEQELIKHKEVCKNIRTSKENKIDLKESLGLKIKEIDCAIRIFLSKHDVLNKIKNAGIQTISGSAFSIAIQTIISILSGTGIGIPLLLSELPVCAYIGISNIIKNMVTKTSYEKYAYKQSNEYLELVEKSRKEFEEDFKLIGNLIKNKQTKTSVSDIVLINNKIIEIYDKVKDNSKIEELSKQVKLEKHNLLLENKYIMDKEIEKYINNQKVISIEEYQKLNKYNIKNNVKLFESENAIKEGAKESLKKLGLNSSVLIVARVIASAFIPGYQINDVYSILYSLGILTVNDLIGIINYNGKLVNSKYKDKKINMNDVKKFKDLSNNLRVEESMAL